MLSVTLPSIERECRLIRGIVDEELQGREGHRRLLFEQIKKPAKFHGYPASSDTAREKILKREWKSVFKPEEIEYYCDRLDSALLQHFNYTCRDL
jgi:hypothetical protein